MNKPGIKSTEFWMVMVGVAVTVLNSLLGLDLDKESIMAMLGTIVAYITQRGYLKRQDSTITALADARRETVQSVLPPSSAPAKPE